MKHLLRFYALRLAFVLAAAVIWSMPAHAGTFSTAAWTDDASTGINPGRTQWAYHFGTDTTINGVSVPGLAGPNASTSDFDLTGMTDAFIGDTNNVTGTGSAVMAQDFVYGGTPATITLKGLTPGRNYVVSFFSVGWQADGGDVNYRNVTFSSGADSQLVQQDQFGDDNGIRVDYAFTAVTTTRSITIAVANPNGATFHLYGLVLAQPPFVSNTNDSGTGSLRQAIANAAAFPGADTVTFDAALYGQTITLASEIVISDTTGAVTVDTSTLAAPVTIDGGTGTNRIFSVSSGKNLALLGLMLTGGNGGGAVGDGNGGAIVNFGTLALTRCTLSGNSGGSGGAILNDGGTLALTQCTLSGNSATTGGALYQTTGTLTLSQCTLSGNHASGDGGAIYPFGGALTLTQCTLSGNSAKFGGALSQPTGTMSLTHCTLSGNQASGNGGAIYNEVQATLTNDVVAGNTAGSTGPDISSIGTITRIGVNFIGDPAGSGLASGSTILTTAANGPINLAPLDNYGGLTKTMALILGSPARNAAAILSPAQTSDQRGFPIVAAPDIGAYEAGTLTNYNAYIWELLPASATVAQHLTTADYDGDGVSNLDEYIALTNPGDPASRFRLINVARSGANIELTYTTVVGRNYNFEFGTDLIGWTPLLANIPGTGGPITTPLGPVTGFTAFFVRVRTGP